MHHSRTLYVGLDVHQESIAVASVAQDHGAEVTSLGTIGTRQADIDDPVRKLHSKAKPLVFGYDAGPCGDGLSRSLSPTGDTCGVVAPSLMPKKAGDRVNTDRREAVPRARLRRAGDRTPVSVPTVAADALRALTRARAEAINARKAATFRLKAFWLRHDIRDTGRATWSPAHRRGLAEVGWPPPAPPIVFPEEVRAVTAHTARLQRLDQARHEQVNAWRVHPVVEALQAWRGVQFTVAVTLVAELGDLTRVDHPRPLRKVLGRMPAAYSTGARRRQGSITNAGHSHARRGLGEGAWASR